LKAFTFDQPYNNLKKLEAKTMKTKQVMIPLAVIMLALSALAACSSPTQSTAGGAAQPAAGKVVKIDVASVYDGASAPVKGTKKFATLVEERTKGAIKVNVFPNGQLGSERDIFNNLSNGDLQMIIGGIQGVDMFAPKYMFITAPYLFKDFKHVDAILQGDLGKKMIATLDEKNAHLLAINNRGVRQTISSKPFRTPAELKGIKLRLPEVQSWVSNWKDMGASPTPIALPELYGASQNKVVDASEGPYEQIATYKLYEVQKYLINTAHVIEPTFLWINKKFLDGLPKDQQDIIVQAGKEGMKFADEEALKDNDRFFSELKSKGVEVIEPDIEAFRKVAQPILETNFKKNWDVTSLQEVMTYAK
jgi:tripartite ATP-independent transporter DctP family solute receptor